MAGKDGLSGNGLTCVRGERLVFAGLDFAVASGEFLQLRGANGSGKSSLLRLIAGLLKPAAGPSPGTASTCAPTSKRTAAGCAMSATSTP